MKKLSVLALVVALGFLLGTVAYGWGGGYGPWSGTQGDVNKLKAFQRETLPLRDEVIAKRLELRNEYAKETPDGNRVLALEKEIFDLQTKIQATARKQGLPLWGPGSGMGGGWGRGYGPMGRGGYGPGYGGGPGRGYSGGYCPMWQ